MSAATEHVFTIAPCFEFRREGMAARATRTMPKTFTSKTLRHSSSELSSTVPWAPIPALLTTTSKLPKSFAAMVTARDTLTLSDTSHSMARSPTPTSTLVTSRSSTATRHPSANSLSTVARPIPDAPPVTIAVSPANSIEPRAEAFDFSLGVIPSPHRLLHVTHSS